MCSRMQNSVLVEGEARIFELSKLLREADNQEFSFGWIERKQVSRHPVGNM